MDRVHFELLKAKYGHWTSWAIWAEEGDSPKSNVGDLSVFEGTGFLDELKPNIVFVGLNISRGLRRCLRALSGRQAPHARLLRTGQVSVLG